MEASEALSLPVVAIVGGYLFISNCNFTKVWCWQFAGHQLYFAYVTAGIVWLVAARALQLSILDGSFEAAFFGVLPILSWLAFFAISLGIAGHVAVRAYEFSSELKGFAEADRFPKRTFVSTVGGVFVLLLFTKSGLSFVLTEAVPTDVVLGGLLWLAAVTTISPSFRDRRLRPRMLGPLHKRLMSAFRPRVFDGVMANWYAASFRVGLAVVVFLGYCFVVVAFSLEVQAYWKTFSQIDYLGLFTMALAISYTSTFWLNLVFPREVAKDHSIRRGNEDKLEALVWRSQADDRLVQIDLDNRKVYIGWIVDSPADLAAANAYIAILPLMSGYRKPRTFELVIDIGYQKIYSSTAGLLDTEARRELAPRYQKLVDTRRVVSASRFDFRVFRAFMRQRRLALERQAGQRTGRS